MTKLKRPFLHFLPFFPLHFCLLLYNWYAFDLKKLFMCNLGYKMLTL